MFSAVSFCRFWHLSRRANWSHAPSVHSNWVWRIKWRPMCFTLSQGMSIFLYFFFKPHGQFHRQIERGCSIYFYFILHTNEKVCPDNHTCGQKLDTASKYLDSMSFLTPTGSTCNRDTLFSFSPAVKKSVDVIPWPLEYFILSFKN